MTQTIPVHCPRCHRPVTIDSAAFAPPEGQQAFVVCPECHHKSAATAFADEHERNIRDAERAKQRDLDSDKRAERQRARDEQAECDRINAENARQKRREEQQDRNQRKRGEELLAGDAQLEHERELETGRTLNDRDMELIQLAIERAGRTPKAPVELRVLDGIARAIAALGFLALVGQETIQSTIWAVFCLWFVFRRVY